MTSDFFDREARAQKQTRRLVWLYVLTVLMVLVVNNLLVGSIVCTFRIEANTNMTGFPFTLIASALYLFGEAIMTPLHFLHLVCRPMVMLWISLGTLASIAGGCYYKMRQLSAGGSAMAELLGGRAIPTNTTDPDEQRLRNVISEMAIASGVPVPDIYVLDNERGINTFAAGHTRHDVAIGVTRGALKLLTRDELQGVIAHEFSHILNGDTGLNMKLIGLAHGLFWPTILGRVLTYGTSEEIAADNTLLVSEDQTKMLPTAPLGFVFTVIGSVSLPFVRLIKSAICRQREWLADSAAVQFTRNPEGISGALKKIGGLFKQGRLDTPHAEVASHLYFVDSDYTPWFRFLATHPPLEQRIKAIDPAFDGAFPKVAMLAPNQYERDQAFDTFIGRSMSLGAKLPDDIQSFSIGISGAYLKQVSLMRLTLPADLKDAFGSPDGAAAIIFALLLNEDDSLRAKQMKLLQTYLAPNIFTQVIKLAPQIAALGDRYKFILAEYALPALYQYNTSEHDTFHQLLQQLFECEGSMDLFEYMLMKMVSYQLRARFGAPINARIQYGRVADLLPECALLLSALAYLGNDDETTARAAFASGVGFLDAPKTSLPFLTRNEWDLAKVDAALTDIAGHHEPLRRNILMACSKTVMNNGTVSERDAELLRAIAAALDCPMPPFVEATLMDELVNEAKQT